MSLLRTVTLTCLLSLSATAASAATLDSCVDLGDSSQISRAGAQFVVVKHDSEFYRVGFRQTCSDLTTTNKMEISSEQQANRLCPSGSVVKTARDTCDVGKVDKIDEAAYDRYRRQR
ncbi:hypothetical protein [Lysobacter sp. Root690]|uniref:hypothetical protein n=1 Tax=Lysobacter sp. Root690 TaxID=1736588 RepID=UPI0007012FA1|nr:hypothetical protein [Lysobacter sp. Root690]KRB04378.1 hypothetical protein ASD86_18875 [Lysobacter sp. Root690]